MRKYSYLLYFLLPLFLGIACHNKTTFFKKVDAAQSGLLFINEITENDSLNILESEFVYNGAGVAIGDLNGDGWDDLFFAGNQVDNKLFLNKGDLTFEDVSSMAKVGKINDKNWSSGVNLIDLNLDGNLDIYVCNTLDKNPNNRKNLLYINQGNNDQGIPLFQEMGERYGVADTSHSSHAQFFDYDNDGDLDLFIGVNWIVEHYPNEFTEKKFDGTDPNQDKLFQNNWNETLGHPVFTDVSLKAGLIQDGYSHSTLIYDFNQDGWADIYVANDYQSDDLIFINQKDGTFKDEARKMAKHYSLSAMGSDLADINNDGLIDFFTSEMQPYYNKRKKLFQGGSNYQREILTRKYDFHHQYTRNTLQLNQGMNPQTGLPIYSDISFHAGVMETDWSWATLFADYDNDGWQDLYIANGFPKDVTDRDFSDFRSYASRLIDQQQLLAAIPEIKSPNFMFRNQGGLHFENITSDWGLNVPSFSNGAAYGDLDKDGDLDLVVNNIDDLVFLFENQAQALQATNNFLRIKLTGPSQNPAAIGTSVEIFSGDHHQKNYLLSGKGYLSKSESIMHFGLGSLTTVDSIHIIWPGGRHQKIDQREANQVLEIKFDPSKIIIPTSTKPTTKPWFKEIASDYQLDDYQSKEIDFIDFNFQRTLPHKFSQYGPCLAVGDVDGNGLEDVFIGGSRKENETWFLQQIDGQFIKKEALYKKTELALEEDAGSLLFDADQDGDLDLYIARGSAQYPPGDSLYQDVLLLNDGQGNFTLNENALPIIRANGSCVKAADFDRDGDLDLFVGSRVLPYSYPKPDRSFILKNESSNGNVRFVDATNEVNAALAMPGLISDALWTDVNGDSWPDLLLAGEWMPIRLFENQQGKLVEKTEASGLADHKGWWTSLAAADLDKDGDMDYLAGNFGKNINFQCSAEQPMRIYGKDLDRNGSIDPLISCYWLDSLGGRNEYLYHPLQDVIKQFVGIRKKYNSFGEYGAATVPEMFEGLGMEDALVLSANWMKTSWLENRGDGQLVVHALPDEAQLAPVYGMIPFDLNGDTYPDVLLVGNDFGMEVQQGQADAFMGLSLLNNGNGEFNPLTLEESHFLVPGDAKSLVLVNSLNEKPIIVASQNRAELKAFSLNTWNQELIGVNPNETKAMIQFLDDSQRLEEFFWGNTFQSQSGRFLYKNERVKSIRFYDQQGNEVRLVQ